MYLPRPYYILILVRVIVCSCELASVLECLTGRSQCLIIASKSPALLQQQQKRSEEIAGSGMRMMRGECCCCSADGDDDDDGARTERCSLWLGIASLTSLACWMLVRVVRTIRHSSIRRRLQFAVPPNSDGPGKLTKKLIIN